MTGQSGDPRGSADTHVAPRPIPFGPKMLGPKTLGTLALLVLSQCTSDGMPVTMAGYPSAEDAVLNLEVGPPSALPGSCWGKDTTPARIETVTEQILLHPAEILTDGTVTHPAVYKTETRQQIVKERREIWFETPCSHALTPDFIASLQRALEARGVYRGPINGQMDRRTRRAVHAFQEPQGLDSGTLSLAAARKLGLVAIEIEIE